METNYTLKRLKLFGPVFAVLFAVFMFGSFRAEAQTVTITGSTEVCLATGGTLATYTAAVTGGVGPFTYAWTRSSAYGDFSSGQLDQTVSVIWDEPTCDGQDPAWVRVVVTDDGALGAQYEGYLNVNLYNPLPSPPATVGPFVFCENAAEISISAPDQICNERGIWKAETPGQIVFADDEAFTTLITETGGTSGITPGVYTLTWTLMNDGITVGACAPTTVTTTLTINEEPAIGFSFNDVLAVTGSQFEYCFDRDISVTLSHIWAGVAPFSVTYAVNGSETTVSGLDLDGVLFENTYAPGTYTITITNITDANGCSPTDYAPWLAYVEVLPEPTLSITAPAEVCADENFEILVNVLTGTGPDFTLEYSIDGPTGVISGSLVGTDGLGVYTITMNGPWVVGTYTFTVTDFYDEYCEIETLPAPFTIDVLPLPVATLTATETEICFNGSFDVILEATEGIGPFTAGYTIEGPAGFDPITDSMTGDEGPHTFSFDLSVTPYPAGVYTFTLTSLVDDYYGCVADQLPEPVMVVVHPEPNATISGEDEVCYGTYVYLSLVDDGVTIFDSTTPETYTVTWVVTVDGAETSATFIRTNTHSLNFIADEATLPGLDRYVTTDVNVEVTITNVWGCTNIDPLTFTFEVQELPHVVQNEIKLPQIGQNVKYVFCTLIPKDLIVINSQSLGVINDDSCEDMQYRWIFRELVDGEWGPWSSVGVSYTGANLTVPAEFTNTVQFRREARGLDCDCGTENGNQNGYGNNSEWFPSNVVTLYVVPQIAAVINPAGAEVCWNVPIEIEGNMPVLPVYDAEGNQTDHTFEYLNASWTFGEGLVYNEAAQTITATVAGVYEVSYKLDPKGFVYAECTSAVEDYCCESDEVTETFVFEQITIADAVAEAEVVCIDGEFVVSVASVSAASGLPVTVNAYAEGPGSSATWATVTPVDGIYEIVYNPSIAGIYTITFVANTSIDCPVETQVVVEKLPAVPAPVTSLVEVCFDTEAHAFDVAAAPEGFEILWRERTSVEPEVFTLWSDAALPTKTEAGEYLIQVKYRRIAAPNCEGPSSNANMIIHALPVISSVAVTSDNTCYGEVIEVTVTHTSGAVLNAPTYDGAGWDEVVDIVGGATTTVLTFAGESLDIGIHTWVFTVDYTHSSQVTCTSNPVTAVFEVTPPVYATFSPFYRKDAAGDIIYIPAGSSITNPTGQDEVVPMVTYVPIQQANDNGLFIEFSAPVTSQAPAWLPLPDVNQGEFIVLHKNTGTVASPVWEKVDVIVTHVGNNRFAVRPVVFNTSNPKDLEWNTMYRLSHQNVYKTTCGEKQLVEYRLSKIDQGQTVYAYDEFNTNAYSKNTAVYFKTMPEEFVNLPIVYPTDDDARCKEIYVDFTNPVSYLSGQEITAGGDPKFKFDLQKEVNGVWVSQLIIDKVTPSNFADATPVPTSGPVRGPKRMTISLTRELDYGAEYRIAMTFAINEGYGFRDLNLGNIVLGAEIAFDTQNTGLGGGWSWSTAPDYPVVFDVEPWPTDWFGTKTAPVPTTMNNITFSNAFDNVVSSVENPVGVFSLVKEDEAYDVDFFGGNFTVTADPGEGYHFVRWKRSKNGGTTFTNLPVARTNNTVLWETEGYHFFPASFTFRPDTFEVRTSATNPDLTERVWIHAECGDELVYKAEFAKNTYTVRSRPAMESAPTTVNNNVGVVTTVDGTNNRVHGTTVRITATPKAGFYFKGWNTAGLPSSIVVTEIYTPPTYENILNPLDHTAILEIQLLGNLTDKTLFDVYALFDVFEPKIYAAAQGIKKDGTVDANITNIEFKTLFVANIQQTGLENAGVFTPDGFNFYEWATFKNGNPSYPPNVAFSAVEVRPLDVPCEYVFDTWERWDPTIGESGAFRPVTPADGTIVGEFFTFIPTENYRLRATFQWKTDRMVSVAIDDTYVTDPLATGTYTVKNLRTNTSYQSNEAAFAYEPWDIIEITIYPQSGYMTYGWVDGSGNVIPTYNTMADFLAQGNPKVGGIIKEGGFPKRLSDGLFRTVWHYIVGCEENVDLKAVMAKKRFHVEAYVNPTSLGSITAWAAQFPVNPHPIVINGSPVIFGYWAEDMARLGFVATPVSGAKKTVKGYFEEGVDVTVTVNETAATSTVIPKFDRWMLKDNGNWIDLGAPEVDGKKVTKTVMGDMVLQAYFINTFEPNRWRVVLADNPDGASSTLSQVSGPLYTAGQSVTAIAAPRVGYDFTHWTSSVVIGLTPLQMQNPTITFNAPANPPALVSELLLTAHYVKTDYDIIAKTRTYIKTNQSTPTWPFTDGNPYLIGEEQATPVAGGTVTATAAASPTTFGTDVTVKAKPFSGFRLINFMVGNILSNGEIEGIQINPYTDDFVYWTPGVDYSEFTFTIPEGDDLGIWFKDVDELHIFAIFGETGQEEFPGHKLVTRSQPIGFATIKGDPAFVTNDKADGLFVYGSVVPVSQAFTQAAVDAGYVFTDWTVNKRRANNTIYNTRTVPSLDEVVMTFTQEGDWKEVIANYQPITYQLVVNNATPSFGTVTGTDYYQMTSQPLPVSATVATPDCESRYEFHGWYRDANFTVPFLDEGGTHITDLQFNFIPEVVVPYPNTVLNIYAKFVEVEQTYEINLNVALNNMNNPHPAGQVSVTPAKALYNCGDQVVISATDSDPVYKFQHWVNELGIIIANNTTFNHIVEGDVNFTAIYKYQLYDLTVVAETGGVVVPDGVVEDLTAIDIVSLSATALPGYDFTGWIDDLGVEYPNASFEFAMPARNAVITATFAEIRWDVTFNVGDAGVPVSGAAVTVSGTSTAGFPVSLTGLTAANGSVKFENVLDGTYSYSVAKAGYVTVTGNVVVDQDRIVNVEFNDSDAPTGLAAYTTAKSIFIRWDAFTGITNWEVKIGSGAWIAVSGANTYTVTPAMFASMGLVSGQEYTYKVRKKYGTGSFSAEESGTFKTVALGNVNKVDGVNSADLARLVQKINGTLPAGIVEIESANQLVGVTAEVFILDAADINADTRINVLDIVSLINIILAQEDDKVGLNSQDADIYLAPGVISLDSDGTLTALQFELNGFDLDQVTLKAVQEGFVVSTWIDGSTLHGILFSPENRAITAGKNELISVTGGDALTWGRVFAGNLNADEVNVNAFETPTNIDDPAELQISLSAYPNPSRGQFTTSIEVPVSSRVDLSLIDMVGREVARKQVVANGSELVSWNENLESGYYILRMVATPENAVDRTFIREVRILINK